MAIQVDGPRKWMSIQELVEKTGLSRHTIHYYLKEKLLPPPLKTGRTMALYTDDHARYLRFIRELREKRGLSIAEVRSEVRRRFGEEWKSAGAAMTTRGKDPRRGPKGRRQRQMIIKKAIECFSQKGYHRTHVSNISEALSVSKGTFYQYFESKYQLFVTVFDEIIKLLTLTEERIANETDFFRRMRERGVAYLAFYEKYHRIIDIIRAESIGQEHRSKVSIQAIYQKMLDPMYEDMRKAYKEGLIPNTAIEPEIRVDMLFGAFDFLCFRLLSGHPYSRDEIIEVVDRLFFHR